MRAAGPPRAHPLASLLLAVSLLSGALHAAALEENPPGAPDARASSRTPVVCYVETVFGGVRPEQVDLSLCTHVVEAFAVPDASGAITAANGIPRRELIGAARANGAQVLLALGGATVSGETFSRLAGDAAARARLFEALRRLVIQGGYDGVDLDWEFPRPGEAGRYSEFVHALRAALDAAFRDSRPGARPLLFLGISPGAAIENYDFPALARDADLFIEFGYDFKNPALGPWANDKQLWLDGSLDKIEASVRGAASACVGRGLPREKLIIALPLYTSDGRPWLAVREKVLASPPAVQPLYLESQLDDGAWVTGPRAMEAKARKILSGVEIAGGAAAGVALWQLGHQGAYTELTEALRRALPPARAQAVRPANEAELRAPPDSLLWELEPGAPSAIEAYEVYLGSSREEVLAARPGSPLFLGRVRNPRIAAPRALAGRVFWRVDVLGNAGLARGAVWSFTLRSGGH